jgi:hypothetical protein
VQIEVKLGEPLWRSAGRRRLSLDWPAGAGVTVADVLARLAAEYERFAAAYQPGGPGRASPYRIFVDAVPAPADGSLPGLELAHGQTLYILLPAAGG